MTCRLPLGARLLLEVSILLAAVLPSHAQAFLVKDIQTGVLPGDWPSGTEFVELGGIAYFRAFDRIHGSELWRSDGTAGGTTLVRDICPGFCSSSPFELTVAGSSIFFRADDGARGPSLWKSDGTAAGTVLIKEVEPFSLAEVNGMVAFAASSPGQGQELWRSDGTAAGTFSLGDLLPGSQGSLPQPLGRVGAFLLFRADDGLNGRELWRTDGTVAGTAFVEDIRPGPDSAFPYSSVREGSAVAGGKLLFRVLLASGPGGYRLWGSDGTPSGTAQVKDVSPSPDLGGAEVSFVLVGDEVFFSADGLWKSNGTEAGTVPVPSSGGLQNPSELTAVGDRLFFKTASGFFPDAELYVSDGTDAGTGPVPLPPEVMLLDYGTNGFLALGSKLVFFGISTTGTEPWISDGTEAGTIPLADIYPGADSSHPFSDRSGVVGGLWLFRALTLDGWELWKSDGTPAGTQLLKRIDQSEASGLEPQIDPDSFALPVMADLAGTLLFSADDGSAGRALWRSDGTSAGTWLLKDLSAGSGLELTPFGGKVFFSSGALWSSDGTEAGTTAIPPGAGFPHDLTLAGGQLYFLSSGLGDELRRIGTSDTETTLVKFLYPGIMQFLTAIGPRLFFTAFDGDNELWTSDGTEAGTQQVSDIAPTSSSPRDLTAHLGTLFFSADDGAAGRELWKSDGTAAGTHRIKDILPGMGSSDPCEITSAGGLVFFVADDGLAGAELWKSDGTAAGTTRMADIRPGPERSWIHEITALGDKVFFAADDGVHGVELWVSDGTETGTHLVKDAVPGAASSYPRYLTSLGYGHFLLFAAEDGSHGLEPWKSDGTEAGTTMIQDIAPGPASSTPTAFTASGSHVYFPANDGAHGFELWAIPLTLSSVPLDFHTVTPCRVFDTRETTPLTSGTPRVFSIGGTCGIPSTAKAVAANLTVTGATSGGHIVVWPTGTPVPPTSNMNFLAGQVRANNAVLGLTSGQINALAAFAGGGTVHLIFDVTGYLE